MLFIIIKSWLLNLFLVKENIKKINPIYGSTILGEIYKCSRLQNSLFLNQND